VSPVGDNFNLPAHGELYNLPTEGEVGVGEEGEGVEKSKGYLLDHQRLYEVTKVITRLGLGLWLGLGLM
jgi:hypothetical protein